MIKLKKFTNILEAERLAKKNIRLGSYNWLISGAEDGFTTNKNKDDLEAIKIIPKILSKNFKLDLTTNFFGTKIDSPIILSPMGHQTQFHSQGEAATAAAITKTKNLGFFSTQGRISFEKLKNKNENGKLVWQIFPFGDKDWILKEIKKAEKCKSLAICFCFDAPVRSFRYLDRESNYDARKFGSGKPISQNPKYALKYDWEFIKWVKKKTTLKIIPKGLMNKEDIFLAKKYGSNALWISNHGGRMFNSGFSPVDILKKIKNYNLKLPIIVDGGVRKGSDIIKYMCLGADFVGIGRPAIYGLILGGQKGVEKIFNLFYEELFSSMTNGGFKSLKDMKLNRIEFSEKK